jgi:CubicO group peptidase (beta-lactamase class C family)
MLFTLILAAAVHPFPATLDTYIEEARKRADVPGIAIAVVEGDSVIAAKGYGLRRLGSPEGVDADTQFDVASLTKSFTAATIATLVDEGKLGWDDRVRDRMPEVLFPRELDGLITIRDLLAHRVGLEPGNPFLRLSRLSRDEIFGRIRFLRTRVPLRSDFVYSNIMYALAAAIAERASGKAWPVLLQERLLTPLGMSASSATHALRGANVASPHAPLDGVQQPIRQFLFESVAGASGVISTANDMAKWMQFQLGDGTWNGKPVISAQAMMEMHSPQTVIPTTSAMRAARQVEFFAAYGFGWNIMDYRGHPMLWHSGNANGMPSYMAILPKEKIGVLVMINSWRVPVLHGAIASRVLDAMLELPTSDYAADAIASYAREVKRAEQQIAATVKERMTGTAPSAPIASYAGEYADEVFGRFTIAVEGDHLTLQFAKGEIADLRHWQNDTFQVIWRDPVAREDYQTFATFLVDEHHKPLRFEMQLYRERIDARRR